MCCCISGFLEDRKFNNTTKGTIRSYQTLLGEFVEYCTDNQFDDMKAISGEFNF